MMLAWAEASFEMMRPPIRTASRIPTSPRVLMLANCEAGVGVEVVGFDEGVAGGGVAPLENGGVCARIERGQDGGLAIVVRLETGRGDGAFLGVAPVVVGEKQSAAAVAQFEGGIAAAHR